MKIAIQGLEGSFHHQAALEFFGDQVEIAPCETFRQVFELLDTGMVDRAVVAIENSLYGSINDTYDLLMQHKPWIIGEIYLHVRFHLLARDDASLSTITDIYSQAPALAETKLYLRKNLPGATQHEYADTAMAARFVAKQNNNSSAAIASEEAGKRYGLAQIESGIEDHKLNYTRFVVLSKQRHSVVDATKSSIVLRTQHTPGDLYRALGAFANNDLNLTKLESRPIVDDRGWQYIFYVDFEGGEHDERTKTAIKTLKQDGNEITWLGSYTKGSLPSISELE